MGSEDHGGGKSKSGTQGFSEVQESFKKNRRSINTKEEFIDFVKEKVLSIRNARLTIEASKDWNWEVPNYLAGMAAWMDGSEGFYSFWEVEQPEELSWRYFADVIEAALVFEPDSHVPLENT